jgi:hypothetical protein
VRRVETGLISSHPFRLRIVQEALTNTLKHADASRVNVLVRYGPGRGSWRSSMTAAEWRRRAANVAAGFIGMNGRAALFGGDPPTASGFLSTPSISASSSTPSDRTKALAWNGPIDVDLDLADPTIPNLKSPEPCQLLDAGQQMPELG